VAFRLQRSEAVRQPVLRAPPTLEELYRDHFDFVYRASRQLGGRQLAADDVAQEVFLVVARRLESYVPSAHITTWLYGITFNVVRSMRRRLRLELRHRADESDGLEVPLASCDTLELAEAWQLMQEVLASMAPRKRDVFVLAELEELSCAEIGLVVGAKEETVWSRLHYARREFAERLAVRKRRKRRPR
jgi:RNA polymerase sigma-70 factor (ECF subfamily)